MTENIAELIVIFSNSSLCLPTMEVMLFLGLLTICLLFRWSKAGLIIAYMEAYRWGWLFFSQNFKEDQFYSYIKGYAIFGASVIVLYLLSWLIHSRRTD